VSFPICASREFFGFPITRDDGDDGDSGSFQFRRFLAIMAILGVPPHFSILVANKALPQFHPWVARH
jgi:hypothetical protein